MLNKVGSSDWFLEQKKKRLKEEYRSKYQHFNRNNNSCFTPGIPIIVSDKWPYIIL